MLSAALRDQTWGCGVELLPAGCRVSVCGACLCSYVRVADMMHSKYNRFAF